MLAYLQLQINRLKRFPLFFLAPLGAFVVLLIPLQKYISLARFQHLGLALSVWGIGYICQTIWSWSRLSFWAKTGYTLSGIYFASLALTFYSNPWLDTRAGVELADRTQIRHFIGYIYLVFTVVIGAVWIKCFLDENKRK